MDIDEAIKIVEEFGNAVVLASEDAKKRASEVYKRLQEESAKMGRKYFDKARFQKTLEEFSNFSTKYDKKFLPYSKEKIIEAAKMLAVSDYLKESDRSKALEVFSGNSPMIDDFE